MSSSKTIQTVLGFDLKKTKKMLIKVVKILVALKDF